MKVNVLKILLMPCIKILPTQTGLGNLYYSSISQILKDLICEKKRIHLLQGKYSNQKYIRKL